MKKKIFTIGLMLVTASINAQEISDSVALGAGYVNESYYSLEDGEVANVANNDWDLAFDVSAYGATIRANRLSEVYLYPGGIADWETLDTAGISDWTRLYNSDASWSYGALNMPADAGDPADLGWGLYNGTTHFTEGNRLFVVKLQSGDYKKLFIEELGMGTYTFQYDFLDNSDFTNEEVAKADYSTKNFIHYSLETKAEVSREPNADTWDIVFSNYHSEIAPDVFYGVTGVLSNVTTEVLEVNNVPVLDATFDGEFAAETNVIGHDWKSFNMETFAYDIADSLTYFVFSETYDVWKLVFTGFNGSIDGKIYFTKEKVSAAGVREETLSFSTYPNPAVDILTINSAEEIAQVRLYNMNGQMIIANTGVSGNKVQLEVAELGQGTYVVEIQTGAGETFVQKIIIADQN